MRLEQRQVAKVGIKGQLAFTLAGLGDITAIHQHQRVGRTGPHAGRALVIEVAEVAFHGNSAHARYPVKQRADARRRRRRGGRQPGIGIRRDIQRAAAGKFNGAERAGNAAQFAAYAQALVELDRAIDALDGVNRADGGAGSIFTVVAHLRCRFFFITHHLQPRHSLQAVLAMRLRASGFAGAAADTDSGVSNYKTVHRVILG